MGLTSRIHKTLLGHGGTKRTRNAGELRGRKSDFFQARWINARYYVSMMLQIIIILFNAL
jgi:hypothetical protein